MGDKTEQEAATQQRDRLIILLEQQAERDKVIEQLLREIRDMIKAKIDPTRRFFA